jgi:hypothetical protein
MTWFWFLHAIAKCTDKKLVKMVFIFLFDYFFTLNIFSKTYELLGKCGSWGEISYSIFRVCAVFGGKLKCIKCVNENTVRILTGPSSVEGPFGPPD